MQDKIFKFIEKNGRFGYNRERMPEEERREENMELTYYGYSRCGTCRKAKNWLGDKDIPYNDNDIVQNPPDREELAHLYKISGIELKKFFNTSGKKYRELGLKDKVKSADESELLDILASDGMLLKRPIVTDGEKVTVGFKEEHFEEVWNR